MSLFKSLLLAILATLLLTYMFGYSVMQFFDIDIYMNHQVVEPLKAISVSALIAVIVVLVAVAIIVSVFGSIIFVGMLVFGCIIMAVIGVFWPIFLMALIIWLIARDKKSHRSHA